MTKLKEYGIYDSEMRKEAKIINSLIKLDLEKKIDLKDLYWKLTTGRLLKDGYLCEILNCKLKDIYEIVDRAKDYSETIKKANQEKQYLEKIKNITIKKIEKVFIDIYENNVLNLRK